MFLLFLAHRTPLLCLPSSLPLAPCAMAPKKIKRAAATVSATDPADKGKDAAMASEPADALLKIPGD